MISVKCEAVATIYLGVGSDVGLLLLSDLSMDVHLFKCTGDINILYAPLSFYPVDENWIESVPVGCNIAGVIEAVTANFLNPISHVYKIF